MQEKPQRVTFDLPKDIHKKLKIVCINNGISMRQLLVAAVEDKLKKLASK